MPSPAAGSRPPPRRAPVGRAALDAWALPLQVVVPNSGAQLADGGLVDGDLRERVRRLGVDVHRYAGVERDPEPAAGADRPARAD